jgi:hypothetical protein
MVILTFAGFGQTEILATVFSLLTIRILQYIGNTFRNLDNLHFRLSIKKRVEP